MVDITSNFLSIHLKYSRYQKITWKATDLFKCVQLDVLASSLLTSCAVSDVVTLEPASSKEGTELFISNIGIRNKQKILQKISLYFSLTFDCSRHSQNEECAQILT